MLIRGDIWIPFSCSANTFLGTYKSSGVFMVVFLFCTTTQKKNVVLTTDLMNIKSLKESAYSQLLAYAEVVFWHLWPDALFTALFRQVCQSQPEASVVEK